MRRLTCLAALVYVFLPVNAVHAQGTGGATAEAAGAPPATSALRVFLDCKDRTPCYVDYLRTEIAYVDYVNVREAAHVHLLVTSRSTGAGGREYTIKFIGLGNFAGVDDEVLCVTLPTDTEELNRRSFARTLKLGLVRYALHTRLGSELNVTHRAADASRRDPGAARSGKDPWNYWVFRGRASANADIESSNESRQYNGSFSANRTTDAWKISLTAFADTRENVYTYSSGNKYTSTRSSHDVTGQIVKSLGNHWAAGAKASVSASTYENKDQVLNASAAVEYNFFPYSESTRRQFTLQYVVGVTSFDYIEETVFGQLSETVPNHIFRGSFDIRQTWGSLSADAEISQYLHDTAMRRRTLQLEGDVRLFRGFALNFNLRTSGINDQIYLKKGNATDEEVLARQRQLKTSFRHSIRVGVSYTFGSIYSNVVNTRLSNFVAGGGDRW